MSRRLLDGVERYPENGIKVVIVGGGIGGLGAALECWRKGCEVVVLEKATEASPIGDFFTIPPSGLTTMKHFPSMYEDYHRNVYDCSTHVYTPSGKHVALMEPEWNRPGAVHSTPDVKVSFLKRRPDWARMQLEQLARLGVPVRFGAKVVDVQEYEDVVVVKTSDGQEYSGDICIAASGVGSTIAAFATEEDLNVQDSGFAVARVAFPRSQITEGMPAAGLMRTIGTRPEFRTYLANGVSLILFLTPDWVAWAAIHVNDTNAEESWGSTTDVQSVVRHLERSHTQWDPSVIDFLRQTPGDVVDWNLRWRDPTEKWTSDNGRLVRLGDAAHPFLPTAGNGGVQALEDGISLAECLHIAGKANARWATKVHNKLRFQRTSVLQHMGFVNVDELHHANLDALADATEAVDIGFFRMGSWVWAHDAESYARENYEDCLAALREHKDFVNTNLPPGHKYQPWSLESERKRMMSGLRSGLKDNGYWGM